MRGMRDDTLLGGPECGPFAEVALDYAHNLLVATRLRRLDVRAMRLLASSELFLRLGGVTPGGGAEPEDDDAPEPLAACLRRGLRAYLREHGTAPRAPRPPAGAVGANLRVLGDALDLGAAERAVLQLVIAGHASALVRGAVHVFGELSHPEAIRLAAIAVRLPESEVAPALTQGSRLLASGLLRVDSNDAFPLLGKIEVRRGIVDALLVPGLDRGGLAGRFLPALPDTDLGLDDFTHVRDGARMAHELLAAALRARRPGVNVLLHGPTGTGKTALASLLARESGVPIFVAGRADDEGDSATSHERLQSLMLGQRLVARGGGLLLFDEAEDLFPGWIHSLFGGSTLSQTMSKQWFNHLLEQNPVPTIWITNRIDGMDPAFLRRFAYALELPALGPGQRARVLRRHLGDAHRLAPADVEAVARRFHASPAQIEGAVRTARLLGDGGHPDRAALERVLAPGEMLLTGEDPMRRRVFDPAQYDVAAVAASEDLAGVAERLAGWRPGNSPGLSLCLYGLPGTGKTEFVHYLAHRMGRPVIEHRVSDLLSKWVGDTEKRIAVAFAQAEADDAVLLFDEADTFLCDRRRAAHSWERSQTNELLQQLERFRGIVAVTTNLREELDAASLRRFILKIELRPLSGAQAFRLFRTVLGPHLAAPLRRAEETLVTEALAGMDGLTPGDFAAVARRCAALRLRAAPAELVKALEAELAVKPGARRAAGF